MTNPSNSTEALREDIRRELDKRLPVGANRQGVYDSWDQMLDDLTDGVMVILARAQAQELVSQAFQIRVNRPEP